MAGTKLFVVAKQDIVVQMREYVVRAHDEQHARDLVDAGMYMFESEAETMDTLESQTTSAAELSAELTEDELRKEVGL